MARMAQRTIYLTAKDLEKVDKLADQAPLTIDRATFWRWSTVLGAEVLSEALAQIKPEILTAFVGPTVLKGLLKVGSVRRTIKAEAITEEELDEEELTE